jgi:putative ABC transport system ATP-binding protein
LPNELLAASCDDLVKMYRTTTSEVRALGGITAAFPRAALTAVAGPSGSGKSSLLRLLGALERPTSGTLVVGDTPLHTASSGACRHLRRSTVGYVFQRASDNFLSYLTLGEHLSVATHAAKRSPLIGASEMMDAFGLTERVHHLPSELSGGEQARAAIAQVIVGGAAIIVADEPTAELDTASANAVIGAMSFLVGEGVTFIVATHDRAVIRRADRLIELDHGLLRTRTSSRGLQPVSDRYVNGEPRLERAPDDAERRRSDRAIVNLREVSKSYRHGTELVHAVRDATLKIRTGDFIALVGRSGSGKTTVLNLVAGWERPDAGRVLVHGSDPSRSVPTWSELAVLPQRLGLIEELTIRENIEFPARLNGRLRDVGWLVDRLIDSLGLSELEDRYPTEAAVGEQQRAALARALVLSPRLLLADEPTGHQDRGWTAAVFETLREAAEEGTACLTATHDEGVIVFVDRVLSILDGRLGEATA